eukprot:RCo048738
MALPPISEKGRVSVVASTASMPSPASPAARKGLSAAQVRAIASVFQYADLNNDGTLDFEEMRTLLSDLGYPSADEDVQRVMKQLDSDGSNKIEWKEFKKAVPIWEAASPAAPTT